MGRLITVEQATAEGWYKPNTNGGLCMCGCGQPAPIAPKSSRYHGDVRGITDDHRLGYQTICALARAGTPVANAPALNGVE